MLKISAPAKINLVLEAKGRRPDGYHEVTTVLQTVGWNDWVTVEEANDLKFNCDRPELAGHHNLVWQAMELLRAAGTGKVGAAIYLVKKIPEAAGLGGGSSDAAAALLALSRLWGFDPLGSLVKETAARLGSDVPFFLEGGCAIAEGRGEKVRKLRPHARGWVVIALPPVKAPVNKTRQAYQTLDESHFTKGDRSAVLAAKIEAGGRVDPLDIYNVFDLVAEKLYPGIGIYKSGLEKASGCRFHLAGAGPALFALCVDRVEAQSKVISARGKGFRLTAHAFSHGSRFV